MTQKNYNTIVGCIFLIVAILHLLRNVTGTTVWIDSTGIPFWISWVAFVVALVLGYYGLRHGKKR